MSEGDQWPKIKARRTTSISPWMDIIARDVEFARGEPVQTYHAVGQQDYLAIVAMTPNGLIPIVRQFRPAVEQFTWELPAGLVDPGEEPGVAAARELLEETGYPARKTHSLGAPAAACTGRLSNRVHSFFITTDDQVSGFVPEPGMTIALKSPGELASMIKSGEMVQQLHLGALMLAELGGFLALPRR